MQPNILGWDVGGAHVKVVLANKQIISQVEQLACPLWKGLDQLSVCIDLIQKDINLKRCDHAVTMTGELVDYFDNRKQGVLAIVNKLSDKLQESNVHYYAGEDGFIDSQQAIAEYRKIASANWLASAQYTASKLPHALFVDVGSTTTDIVTIDDHKVSYAGYTDEQRLVAKELVYCGVVRTPVFAIIKSAQVNGQQIPIINEYFANLADVYRLTGELATHADLSETLDGRDKDISSSATRLARMFANDADEEELDLWKNVAQQIRNAQIQMLKNICRHHLMKRKIPLSTPIIGAGVGRFLVAELAQHLGREYIDFDTLFEISSLNSEFTIADCAPAASVACLVSMGNSA